MQLPDRREVLYLYPMDWPLHDVSALLAAWPSGEPLLALAGNGNFAIVAFEWEEMPARDAYAYPLRLNKPMVPMPALPFHHGVIAIVPYDDAVPARFFKVHSALVIDRTRGVAQITGAATAASISRASEMIEAQSQSAPLPLAKPTAIRAHGSDSDYLAMVRSALGDIRAGQFYQINLLRYFSVLADTLPSAWIAARLAAWSGPYGAWLRVPGLELVSFSPERFVAFEQHGDGLHASTHPIKGSAAASTDPSADLAARVALAASKKDAAELAMIVDLMRNDLGRIAMRGTVAVPDRGSLASFRGIHHRMATVTATLAPDLTLADFIAALCPGGSITGAPKIAAMAAIRSYEGRQRGVFMGNLLVWDHATGRFDSSILIRTMARTQPAMPFEYAAGSGIVVASDPHAESDEIQAKTSVLTGGGG